MTERADYQSLTKREREVLSDLCRGAISYNDRRNFPAEYRTLLQQGLAFHAHNLLSVTDRGREVAERVS